MTTLTGKHIHLCPVCQKKVELKSEFNLGDSKMMQFTCGHMSASKLAALRVEFAELTNEQGHHLYPFQRECMRFLRDSNFRALLNLDMGLGKTLIVSFAFKVFAEELLPALVICKSALKSQWMRHIKSATGEYPQVIDNGKDVPMPDIFPVTIASFDILRRFENHDYIEQYKTVVIDETQNIKNPEAARTKQLRYITRNVPHVIGLSGTPIKNHGGEYFSILNILRADMFPTHQQFLYRWVNSYWDGYKYKLGGIRHLDQFREKTRDFIIRYTRDEVMPDLPKINRQFHYTDLAVTVKKAYEAELEKFTKFVDEFGYEGTHAGDSVIGFLSRMRHITGVAKIPMAIAMIEEFLLTSDKKLVVFTHHKDVAELLVKELTRRSKLEGEDGDEQLFSAPLNYHSGLGSSERDSLITEFLNGPARIMIASTLAIGEGTNLQPVADAIMLERQWTPVPEEQAECRFPRPGATADRIDIRYIVALGTIDEMLAELVERKRQIIGEAIDGAAGRWDESNVMRELAELLYKQGKAKWSL